MQCNAMQCDVMKCSAMQCKAMGNTICISVFSVTLKACEHSKQMEQVVGKLLKKKFMGTREIDE